MKNQKIFSWIGFLFILLFAGCQKDEPVKPVVPPEVLKPVIHAEPYIVPSKSTIDFVRVEVSYEILNATIGYIDAVVLEEMAGLLEFDVYEDRSIVFTAKNNEGDTETKTILMKGPVIEPLPLPTIVFFNADQYTLPEGGGATWLSWEILNAYTDSVSINGIMQADTIGSYYTGFVSNPGNTDLQVIYTLIAKGLGGTKTASLTLTIPAVPPPPPLPTAEDTLCMGSWYLIKLEFMTPPSTEWVEYEIWECNLDDFITFYLNPKEVIFNFGTVKCFVGEPQTVPWLWTMSGNVITLSGLDDHIEMLDRIKLIRVNYAGGSDEQVRRTYAHEPLQ